MEIGNHAKSVAARKRGGPQQATQSAPYHSFEPLKLERVYGSGSCTAAAIACPHPVVPGLLAYSCGAVVALYDSQHKQQTSFFSPKPRRSLVTGKPYACLSFSRDGAYLAAGERSPQSPEILVWEVSSTKCLQSLKGHKHGIGSISFSQDGRLLVSTGESYDGQLCVWDWQAGVLLARQHTQAEVQRACFAEELAAGASGFTITTVGKAGHFKVWSLTLPSGRNRDGHLAAAGQASLTPRPASLKEYRTSNFVGVAAAPADGSSSQALLYALTQSGVLLTLRPATRTIDKSLSLQVPAAFALAVSSGIIACACAAGVVRLFAARTLAFRGNLPRPSTAASSRRSTGGGHPDGPGGGGRSSSGGGGMVSCPGGPGADPMTSNGALFPDAVGCAFDSTGERLTVAYADRSLMVWDVRNPARVTRMRSVLSHGGIVWSAALIPPWQAALMEGPWGATVTPTLSEGVPQGDSFAPSSILCTCGTDGTVRLWNVCLNNSASPGAPASVSAAKVTRTLRAIIHAVPPAAPEVAGGSNAASGAAPGNRRYAPDAPLPVPGSTGGATSGGAAGAATVKPVALRCLRVSPCGRHLATGDTRGNLRVFSLTTLQLLMLKEAHDAEILSLDYSPPSLDGACYLVSGSRDTFVHVYDMSRGYELVGTCDAHGGAVTAVRFSAHGGRLALLSCSADKSVVFRLVQLGSCGLSFEIYHTERMSRGVLYDMAVDPSGSRAVTVAQDNQLRLFDVATGRALRNFSGDSYCGEAVAVTMDASGHLAICSCADGSVAVYDVDAGALMARGSGHSDVCTGAVLLEDHRGLVTVGGDGCALLWRLSPRLAQHMQDAAMEARRQLEQQAAAQAAMLLQQRQQQHEQQQDEQLLAQGQPVVTPTVRRRKAWDLGGAMDGSAAPVGQVGTHAGHDGDEGEDAPHQVQVDISATLLRIREGKPLLSLEKLPKWAQRTCTPAAEADLCIDSSSYCANSIQARTTATACANSSSVAGGAPALAGVWAQLAALPLVPAQQHQPEAAVRPSTAVTEPSASAGDCAQEGAAGLAMPFPHGAAAATAAATARASALAGDPRVWAEMVEEDDEIVFCDSLEDNEGPLMLLGDTQDTAPEVELNHTAGPEAGAAKRAAHANGSSKDRPGGLTGSGCGEEHERGSPSSPPALQDADGEAVAEDETPASGCGSNRLGCPPPEEGTTADGEVVKPRDLFREHFDSLGLDQSSATKAPPPDPRRLSFSLMYRHARASSGAGGHLDGATTPNYPGRASFGGALNGGVAAVGGVAAPPLVRATAAREVPTTPHLSNLPLLPTMNMVRGVGFSAPVVSILDIDGAVTSAAWTPERAMLPLTSPALAKTDKQLHELERIRLRLLSTLRKRQTNDEVAMGVAPTAGSAEATAAAAVGTTTVAAATGPPEQPVLVGDQTATDDAGRPGQQQQQQNQQQASAAARTRAPAAAPPQQPQAAEPPQVTAGASGAGDGNTASQQQPPREEVHSAGGFLLPPPPAYSPVEETPRADQAGGLDGYHLPPETPVAQSSPGFSSLTAGTPMLGKGVDGHDVTSSIIADGPCGGATVRASVEDRNNRMFVFNPIYGASPTTPIIGARSTEMAAAAVLQKGLSPRSGGAGADAGPTSSPAGSDTAAPTADDVIRTVLEFEDNAAADANVAVSSSGVCVVITEGGAEAGGGKGQRQQLAPAAMAAAPAAGTLETSPGKLQRSKLVSLPVKPKSVTNPANPPNSLAATVANALACSQASAGGAMGPMQTQGSISEADADAALTRMQSALRDFAGAYRRLVTAAAIAAAAPSVPVGAVSRYHAAARSAVAELEALLSVQDAAGVKPHLDSGAEVPPAVVCRSPQVSLDMSRSRRAHGLSRIGRGFKSGLEASSATSVAAGSVSGSMTARTGVTGAQAVSSSHPVSSSQVLLEVGLVESMVEEKLQQRMQEEMRRVEEAVMQRIMQTMLQQQQQQ